jgi:hypothetical protein
LQNIPGRRAALPLYFGFVGCRAKHVWAEFPPRQPLIFFCRGIAYNPVWLLAHQSARHMALIVQ